MEHTINVAVQVIPQSQTRNAYDLIDQAIASIARSGLKYRVCPFETVIEGNYGEVMKLIERIRDDCFKEGADELLINIKMQLKKDNDVTIGDKIDKYDS